MKFIKIIVVSFYLFNVPIWGSDKGKQEERLITEIDKSLRHDLLDAWYPVSLDTVHGGFLSDFTYNWKPRGSQNKMLVSQTRHIWTASEAAIFYKDDRYRGIAEHGFSFLKDKMWDKEYGGFYTILDRKGDNTDSDFGNYKIAYGNAFAIYALATYYKMSADTSALNLARNTFLWLVKHSYDPEFKGYFNILNRDGSLPSNTKNDESRPRILYLDRTGWKDQNTSIHLLEAFTELYKVWPDSLLHEHLCEMLELVRDTIMNKRGFLDLFFERDWTVVSFRDSSETARKANYYYDHISFGHNLETAYLILEASSVLEIEADIKTLSYARTMVDHALENGWDDSRGGFYEAGYYFNDTDDISIIDNAKIWWVQAEGLNALLLIAKFFPEENKYYKAFRKQWEYIIKYLVDHKNGGWYEEGLDNSPDKLKARKAYDWKINYHNVRALMNCIKMLKSEKELLYKL
ncbi:MAG: AGE family epimerase/isomerase [Bacteroidales bacterium]|nr:MAG: AGE family epimerase/isomerase [Bacteroidales bacterium]